MKELTLLPEDWKGVASFVHASIQVTPGGSIKVWGDFCHADGSRYYEVESGALVELEPVPRPPDSIKLSECDGRHLITCKQESDFRHISQTIGAWKAYNANGEFIDLWSNLNDFIRSGFSDFKIYDMTVD